MSVTELLLSQLVSKIINHDQSQIVSEISELSQAELDQFYEQLKEIDFDQVEIFKKIIKKEIIINQQKDNLIQPVENLLSLEKQTQDIIEELQQIGLKSISQGQLAIITLAGGQGIQKKIEQNKKLQKGTRLGFDNPKGMFKINLHSKKSLFQIFAERINRLYELSLQRFPQKENQSGIQWYLMTSKQTDKETKDFFKKNKNFGIRDENLHFFQQGYVTCIDKNGKILLENENQIYLSPNGNGGVYEALENKKILKQLNEQKIKYVHIVGIDNILVKLGDPTQLGYLIQNNYEIVSKFVKKAYPEECVGVHVLKNQKPFIIEYSDMTQQQIYEKNLSGQYKFNQGFICNFICQVSFLNRIIQDSQQTNQLMVYHQAIKQVSYYDVFKKEIVYPNEKNAYKFELFIFDAFQLSNSFGLIEVNREQEFAPIKNNDNNSNIDTPLTALELVSKLHRQWLIQAGYVIDFQASTQNVFEVDQTISYQGENIKKPSDEHKHIQENNFYLQKQQ
ncbi:udp-n-acetylglucosamine pyrophosphorylase, putative [Ichthyophthirius multifiliis]|uniref:UDP-N-acetylglucosamine diphosphorylase n=1 Tax=Ichthyophthirius multifiliis TaxID=5932 RepID=G0QU74_ICHMU|nr:udp-n-acetylglucosamine pyrophosphorylase, putative [Ichthyophthirius multifiliis]EGR31232.1 udp-n-acetylglucosamine pyrophosphorylase, putative [Ichthyophthirius multifiliis]|eukprot:XP_004034718.1 udp-n-acetylglucosamine pyrophosphorylase, putative [Ichthyophthirius multifiliis]